MAYPPWIEFGGWDLAPGKVRGVRSFSLTRFGELAGVTYNWPWGQGENQAMCFAGFGGARPINPDHLAKCRCGFYGYYDGSDDFGPKGNHYGDPDRVRISAVVDGYGHTVIGTRGFRASKARIVALCLPGEDDAPRDHRRRRSLKLWWRAHRKFTQLYLPVSWMMVCILSTPVHAIIAPHTSPVPWIAGNALGLAAFFAWLAWGRYKGGEVLPHEWREVVRRQYPNVPVFGSFDSMVAAFPPDAGVAPTTMPTHWGK